MRSPPSAHLVARRWRGRRGDGRAAAAIIRGPLRRLRSTFRLLLLASAADLKIRLIHSGVGQPRGRGKIERFFETVTQVLLSRLPGYAPAGTPPAAVLTRLGRLRGSCETRSRTTFATSSEVSFQESRPVTAWSANSVATDPGST